MKTLRILLALGFASSVGSAFAHDSKAPLNAEQKAFLSEYETVRAALAADDLSAAKKAAAKFVTESTSASGDTSSDEKERRVAFAAAVRTVVAAESLDDAREGFKQLSKRAIHYAQGKAGYYVAHCPMVPKKEGNWVQTSKQVSNPYFGKAMPTCGNIN